MTFYYSGQIVFQGALTSKDENRVWGFFISNCTLLGSHRDFKVKKGEGSILSAQTCFEFSDVKSKIDKCDLDSFAKEFQGSHPIISGYVRCQGDDDCQYVFNPKKQEWEHEEPVFLSDCTVADLRDTLNRKCVEKHILGISSDTTGQNQVDAYGYLVGNTTDEDLQEDKDVITRISMEMFDDDENDSVKLLELYRHADERERAIMDAVLVCICGWTMSSIIGESDDLENNTVG